jgi:hypothetical protein
MSNTRLRQSGFARVHQRIAAGNGRNFSDPGTVILTVKNDLVVLELHGVNSSINPETVQG